jgi:hypothetical protein
MPIAMERALKKAARKKGLKPGSDRWNRFVYGTIAKWKKKHGKKRKHRKRT